MGITLSQYRTSIGRFGGGLHGNKGFTYFIRSKHHSEWLFYTNIQWAHTLSDFHKDISSNTTRCKIIKVLGISVLLHLLLLLSGDIESNPGPRDWADISICHVNIRSIRSNPEKLKHNTSALTGKYDIITLSETWLNSMCSNSCLKLAGYQEPYRKDREDDTGYGGVLVWVSDQVAAKRRHDLEVNNLEALWLEIRTKNKKFLLSTIYRPPNTWYHFWDLFQESIDLAREADIPYMVITGDLNADPATPSGIRLHEFLLANSLVSHIDEPTRVTSTQASILDQFVSNVPDFIKGVTVEAPVSTNDHCTIGLHLLFRIRKQKAYPRILWDFKHTNWDNFRLALDNADLMNCITSNDVNVCCEQLTDRILSVAKDTIPNKSVIIRPNDKPWYSEDLRRQRREKDRLYQSAKTRNSENSWTAFNQARNAYCQAIKRAKEQYNNSKYTE